MLNEGNLNCRVCGLVQGTQPWGADGRTPAYEICDCCGVEFGYEDSSRAPVFAFRASWIDSGYRWFNPKVRPKNWRPDEQIAQVPPAFR